MCLTSTETIRLIRDGLESSPRCLESSPRCLESNPRCLESTCQSPVSLLFPTYSTRLWESSWSKAWHSCRVCCGVCTQNQTHVMTWLACRCVVALLTFRLEQTGSQSLDLHLGWILWADIVFFFSFFFFFSKTRWRFSVQHSALIIRFVASFDLLNCISTKFRTW